jgi:hypothetical protein
MAATLLLTLLPTPFITFFTVTSGFAGLVIGVLPTVIVIDIAVAGALVRGKRAVGERQDWLRFFGRIVLFGISLGGFGLAVTYFLPSNLYTTPLEYVPSVMVAMLALWGLGFELIRAWLGAEDDYRAARSNMSGAQFDGCRLTEAHLEGAQLGGASLRRADLSHACLEHANLDLAYCEGADLRGAGLDGMTSLRFMRIGYDLPTILSGVFNRPADIAALGGIDWNGADPTTITWQAIYRLGDERDARRTSITSLQEAVKAYHQLSDMLHKQGLFKIADRFAYRSLVFQRRILLRESGPVPAFGNWLLDLLAGYGYRPLNTLVIYLAVIFGFAAGYEHFAMASQVMLSPVASVIFSISSFHGRGFFPGPSGSGLGAGTVALDAPVTILAACEAIIGLIVEVSFIATFTQRFFGHSSS